PCGGAAAAKRLFTISYRFWSGVRRRAISQPLPTPQKPKVRVPPRGLSSRRAMLQAPVRLLQSQPGTARRPPPAVLVGDRHAAGSGDRAHGRAGPDAARTWSNRVFRATAIREIARPVGPRR